MLQQTKVMNPLLTVGMPVYNAMPYLPSAVESILQQSFKDFELIIVDDGSTDDSPQYLASLRDTRVRVISQNNSGNGAARNRLISEAKGQLFAIMDGDDISMTNRFQLQIGRFAQDSNLVLTGTQFNFLFESKITAAPKVPTDHEQIVKKFLRGSAGMCHSSLMANTAALKSIAGYRIRGPGLDYDFVLRLAECGRIENISQCVHNYRIHSNSIVMTRHGEVRCGILYAVQCANNRRMGLVEPSLEEWKGKWKQRGISGILSDELDRLSTIHYRRGVADKCKGNSIMYILHMMVAALCKPKAAMRRLAK